MYTVQGNPIFAQTAAVAKPCCPAPVSAMIRFLPIRFASSTCPTALLILWAPVFASPSSFTKTCAPPSSRELFSA